MDREGRLHSDISYMDLSKETYYKCMANYTSSTILPTDCDNQLQL